MKTFCQVFLVLLTITQFLGMLYLDFNGREARPPGKFQGALITLAFFAFMVFCLWKVDAFSFLY